MVSSETFHSLQVGLRLHTESELGRANGPVRLSSNLLASVPNCLGIMYLVWSVLSNNNFDTMSNMSQMALYNVYMSICKPQFCQ